MLQPFIHEEKFLVMHCTAIAYWVQPRTALDILGVGGDQFLPRIKCQFIMHIRSAQIMGVRVPWWQFCVVAL